jgi:putative tricarboxylic transport membrane protein
MAPIGPKSTAMFERALNAFWILLGGAAAAYAWTLGLIGASGPESGLFPFLAALIIMGAGVVLLLRPLSESIAPGFPRGAALWRVLGVVAGLAFMAVSMPYLGFAVAGFITMIILLRTVETSGWVSSVVLAFVSVVVVIWLFGRVLGMPLPRGPWGW